MKLYKKDADYFWEYEYPFGEFLKEIFPNNYKRKYSFEGNGIFDLLYIDNKIYELKFTQTTRMLNTDNKKITDKNKEFIMNTIIENLDTEVAAAGGKFLSFAVDKWIAKVEIIKKLKEPV